MMYFRRKVRVTFSNGSSGFILNPGPIADVELKVAFNITRGIESEANSATLQLYNLNESHRNSVGKEFDDILIEAGYEPASGGNNIGVIFKGQLRDVQHMREGPDIVTTLTSGDGDKALRNAVISKSFKAGTKVTDVVDDLYKELEKYGIDRGEVKLPDKEKKFERPYAMCGSVNRELDRLGRGHGFYWSIQNGTFEAIPGDGSLAGSLKVAAYPNGSMTGTPTITDNGVRVSMLLDPSCRPNRTMTVDSEVLEMNAEGGKYRISQADFSGDNRDGDFIVSATGESIREGKVDEGNGKPVDPTKIPTPTARPTK